MILFCLISQTNIWAVSLNVNAVFNSIDQHWLCMTNEKFYFFQDHHSVWYTGSHVRGPSNIRLFVLVGRMLRCSTGVRNSSGRTWGLFSPGTNCSREQMFAFGDFPCFCYIDISLCSYNIGKLLGFYEMKHFFNTKLKLIKWKEFLNSQAVL